MRRTCLIVALAAAGLLAAAVFASAQAQTPPAAKPAGAARVVKLPAEKPYQAVAIKVAPAPDDESFAAFRQQLAAVAKSRVNQELAPLVVARGFFWDGDFFRGLNPKHSSMENFAAAIRLESEDGSGCRALAAFAAAASAAPLPSWIPAAVTCSAIDGSAAAGLVGPLALARNGWSVPSSSAAFCRRSVARGMVATRSAARRGVAPDPKRGLIASTTMRAPRRRPSRSTTTGDSGSAGCRA